MSAGRSDAAARKPLEQLEDLEKSLASKEPPRLIVATHTSAARADEPFLLDWVGRRCVAFAEKRKAEVTLFDAGAPGFDPNGLFAAITTRSMFASASVWIVRQADALVRGARSGDDADGEAETEKPAGGGKRDAATVPFERAVLRYAEGSGGDDQLVVLARRLRAPFLRALRERDVFVVEVRPLYDKPFRGDGPVDGTELGEFLMRYARIEGMRLGRGVLQEIVTRTGSGISGAAGALSKLRSVVSDREITVADVVAHISTSRAGSPWAIAEAILRGDGARALEEIACVAASGARDPDGKTVAADGAFAMALSALARDARRNVVAATMIAGGASAEDAAAAVGVPRFPAAMEAFQKSISARNATDHRRVLDAVAEAELAIRGGGEKARSALVRLAARCRRRPAERGRSTSR